MFSIKDNTIHMATDSSKKINLYIIGSDKETMIEPGYIKTGAWTNQLHFVSEHGNTFVRLEDIESSVIGWDWAERKNI